MNRASIGQIRRIVLKLGSTLVVSEQFEVLNRSIGELRGDNKEIVIVSSGAVALGMELLGLEQRPVELPRLQALAALGQAELMGRYNRQFAEYKARCAQILLTHEDLSHRKHFLNIRHTLETALSIGLIPVVNENDSVATEELRFGDNDRLAAAVATAIDADIVILLSDSDALYDSDPRENPKAQPLREVTEIDDDIRSYAGFSRTCLGTGGMASKIAAAEIAVEAGIPLMIASGREKDVLSRVLSGADVGTIFRAVERPVKRRRHWIGFLSKLKGTICIDDGAAKALRERGSSLLAIGVTTIEGQFDRGDGIRIMDRQGTEVARGLIGYDTEVLRQIMGLKSEEILARLATSVVDAVVHRNDMILMD